MANPQAGQPMRGTNGLRKLRYAPRSWGMGKSGAMRVCYVSFPRLAHVLLVDLYAKNDKANLTAAQCNTFAQYIREYERKFK